MTKLTFLLTHCCPPPLPDHAPTQATNWTMEKIKANEEQRFFKTHANLKDLPCGKAPGVKVRKINIPGWVLLRAQASNFGYSVEWWVMGHVNSKSTLYPRPNCAFEVPHTSRLARMKLMYIVYWCATIHSSGHVCPMPRAIAVAICVSTD